MHTFLTITWDMSKGLDLGFFTLRYYSLLFALGFVLGYLIMQKIFKKEGIPNEKLDTLLTYVVIATVVGARLGHVFFYQWDYYSAHPAEIFKIWEGGLASHGAVVAIILAIVIYCKRVLNRSTLWMLDRLVITIALAGALIRLGNWFNSEIYGDIGNSTFETVFTDPARGRILGGYDFLNGVSFDQTGERVERDAVSYPVYDMVLHVAEKPGKSQKQMELLLNNGLGYFLNEVAKEDRNIIVEDGVRVRWDEAHADRIHVRVLGVPRSPTQIYESLGYLLIFIILMTLFSRWKAGDRQGLIFGLFLILIFGFRFLIEYTKENQVAAEEGLSLNIGQQLSIPLVIIGTYFVIASLLKKNSGNE